MRLVHIQHRVVGISLLFFIDVDKHEHKPALSAGKSTDIPLKKKASISLWVYVCTNSLLQQ